MTGDLDEPKPAQFYEPRDGDTIRLIPARPLTGSPAGGSSIASSSPARAAGVLRPMVDPPVSVPA
jgi:hypothetical protein